LENVLDYRIVTHYNININSTNKVQQMFYTQATIAKINKDVVTYFATEAAAKSAAKRQAKDKDYTAVWFGNPNRMEARVKVK